MSNETPTSEGNRAEKTVTIKVNGTDESVLKGTVTYDQIVKFGIEQGLPTGPNYIYTVTYRKAASKPHEGDLEPGGTIEVKEQTIFNVVPTDKS